MFYIQFEYEGETFYLEIDDQQIATRQIIMKNPREFQISSRMDCLAEGEVLLTEENTEIPQAEFERIWRQCMRYYEEDWQQAKDDYPVNSVAVCKVEYFYPQGIIAHSGKTVFCMEDTADSRINRINITIKGTVIGYDEQNMWVLLSNKS